jgi:uncharacterized protein YecT (DUF1311 family)
MAVDKMFGVAAIISVSLCFFHTADAAEDPAESACGQKVATIEISQCLMDQIPRWDARLNQAYKVAMAASENDSRKASLLKAERAWLAYRTENCGWYGSQEGTIRQIAGAHCMLSMTRDRAIELETANRP